MTTTPTHPRSLACQALRDQLCATLHDLAQPARAGHIGGLIAYAFRDDCWGDHTLRRDHWKSVTCLGNGSDVDIFTLTASSILPHLAALEKQGLCRSLRDEGARGVHWEWTGPSHRDEVDALERVLAAS